MDCVPGQVSFQFSLSHEKPLNRDAIRTHSNGILVDIEGRLKVTTDAGVLFEEPGVLLLELGVDLLAWLDRWNRDPVTQFQYETMSSEEPVMSFTQNGCGLSVIDSPWRRTPTPATVDTRSLVWAVRDLTSRLRAELLKEFGIDLSSYASPLK